MNFEREINSIKNYHDYNEFIFPNYKKNCISNIPGTILNFFGDKNKRKLPKEIFKNVNKNINKIILLVLDGFGLTQFLNF